MSDIDMLEEYNKEYSIFPGFKPFATKENYKDVVENNKRLKQGIGNNGIKEIYYWVVEDRKIVGHGSEAIIEVMHFLFNSGYKNVLSGYDEGNVKSKAIGEKLGFIIYEVKEDAWRKKGIPITTYTSILSEEKFDKLYKLEQSK